MDDGNLRRTWILFHCRPASEIRGSSTCRQGPTWSPVFPNRVADQLGQVGRQRVYLFLRQSAHGTGLITTSHQPTNPVRESCDVDDSHDPLIDIPTHRLATQSNLEGPVRQRSQAQRPLRIPLHPHRTVPQLPRPLLPARVPIAVEMAETGVRQGPLTPGPRDLHSQDVLLPRLGPPTIVHPPATGFPIKPIMRLRKVPHPGSIGDTGPALRGPVSRDSRGQGVQDPLAVLGQLVLAHPADRPQRGQ
ncbi:hypothetical protein IW245_005229 [Longispora fulva]|uniref:Uncharacterized protein n=1 Tax=Longispora fulva TaxID=619741 RepID=A0A8J7KHV2_9ACTN|nr:hypothetical protein [Longispora fulva]